MLAVTSAFAFKRSFVKAPVVSAIRAMSMQIQHMNVLEFDKILKGTERKKYQILDVREKIELGQVHLPGDDIIHLPLSDANNWSAEVISGKRLDSEKPTLVMCHHGMRSMQVASFLGKHFVIVTLYYLSFQNY